MIVNDPATRPGAVLRPEDFPHHATDIIRLGDLDHQNHVNNAVFATYFETGRVGLIREIFGGLGRDGKGFVAARVEINFVRELHWPGTVTVGTAVERIGRTSVTYAQAVFDQQACAAHGRSTLVMIDKESRKPAPIPAEAMDALERYRLR